MSDKEIIRRFKALIEKNLDLPTLNAVISQVSNVETLIKFYELAVHYDRSDVIKCLIPDKLEFHSKLWHYYLEHTDSIEMLDYFFELELLDPYEVGIEAIDCCNPDILNAALEWDDVDIDSMLLECQKYFSLTMIKILVDAGADIHVCEDEMFYNAVKREKFEVVDYIIKHCIENKEEVYCKDEAQQTIVKKYTDAYLKSLEPEDEDEEDSSEDSYCSYSE